MKFPSSLVRLILAVVCLLVLAVVPALAAGDDWKSVDSSEIALKLPIVEKDADAEALFWEVRVDDGPVGELIFTHYLRIKVFTERGREDHSKVDIPFGEIFGSSIKIKDIAARTHKPDGTIVELKKEDVFERDIIKASGVKLPDGFHVDELPDPLKLDTAFGNYDASYDVKDGHLVFTRKLTMRSMTVPAEQYATVRSFFERIRAVEQSPVVLARQ